MVPKNRTKSGVLGAVAALLAAPLLFAAPAAHAAPAPEVLLSCDLSGKAGFSPALSLNPSGESTRIRVDGAATACRSGSGIGVTSAKFGGTLNGRMSCTAPPRDVDGDVQITWTYADGSTRKSTAKFALDMRGDLANPSKPITGTFTGQSTDGEFEGNRHTGRGRIDSAGIARDCLTGGLGSVKFNGTYEMSR
ncbi:hypothetical protein [Saccharopolyspora griseoalba]|uniref:Ig-like domain-containing protein n=1 Tax=Saccharopolyspora griseoalba TaxID=1431848 RepID=A0ABW2LMX0_9PSEU